MVLLSGSTTTIFLRKGSSTPHQNLTMIFGRDFLWRKLNRQPQPHSYHAFLVKASGLSPSFQALACSPWHCQPVSHLEYGCTLSFYSRIFHTLSFLFPKGAHYTLYDDTGLPHQSHPHLSAHSFVVARQTYMSLLF